MGWVSLFWNVLLPAALPARPALTHWTRQGLGLGEAASAGSLEEVLRGTWVSLGQPVTPNCGPEVIRTLSPVGWGVGGGTSEATWGWAEGRLHFVTWIPAQ